MRSSSKDAETAERDNVAGGGSLLFGLGGTPLLPQSGSMSGPLTAVIAVMCFLATLSIASGLVVSRSATAWTTDLTTSVTVQVAAANTAAIREQTAAAVAALENAPGVDAVRPLSRSAALELLEPWLGDRGLPDSLPLPTLIEVDLDAEARPDMDDLRRLLAESAPDATLDDHRTWNDSLVRFARALQNTSHGVLALIFVATAAIIIFAARAALASNREIVDVLHLIGAEDAFIAAQVQRRFLFMSLKGAFGGFALALLALWGLVAASSRSAADGFFLPALTLDGMTLALLAAAPLAACLLATATARIAVIRALAQRI